MKSIKPGMTRADLQKVFTTEGGISMRVQRTYVYRNCPYCKVDVEFEAEVAYAPNYLPKTPAKQAWRRLMVISSKPTCGPLHQQLALALDFRLAVIRSELPATRF
jgi:hypothetical protein